MKIAMSVGINGFDTLSINEHWRAFCAKLGVLMRGLRPGMVKQPTAAKTQARGGGSFKKASTIQHLGGLFHSTASKDCLKALKRYFVRSHQMHHAPVQFLMVDFIRAAQP